MSHSYNSLPSKSTLNIPNPEEFRKNQDAKELAHQQLIKNRQLDFIKKANDSQVGEEIAKIISQQLKVGDTLFNFHIGSSIDLDDVVNFIEIIVKPMFEEAHWDLKVAECDGYRYQPCIAHWNKERTVNFKSPNWINEIFRVRKNGAGQSSSDHFISIQLIPKKAF